MTVLRALRLLVLGETWTLPFGISVVLVAGLALRAAVPDAWHDVGGVLLLAGVLAVLAISVASTRS
jgi:hypothetical protein